MASWPTVTTGSIIANCECRGYTKRRLCIGLFAKEAFFGGGPQASHSKLLQYIDSYLIHRASNSCQKDRLTQILSNPDSIHLVYLSKPATRHQVSRAAARFGMRVCNRIYSKMQASIDLSSSIEIKPTQDTDPWLLRSWAGTMGSSY